VGCSILKTRIFRILNLHGGLIYITAGNLLGAIIGAGFWLLLASLQNAEEYGKINYEISLGSLIASVALLGFNTTINLYSGRSLTSLNVQANQTVLITTGISSIAVLLLLSNWLLALFILTMNFWVMSTHGLLGRKSYVHYSISTIGARASQFVMSIFLYYMFGVHGIIIGFIISFIVFSYPYFFTIRKFSLNFNIVKAKVKSSLHVYSFNLSNALLLYLDKLIIGPLFGYAILGQYQLAFQFLMFFGVIPISFYQYLIPEESSGRKNTRLRTVGLFISVALTIVMFMVSPWIMKTFFPSYIGSSVPTQILSLGTVPMMVVWIVNSKLITTGKTKLVLSGAIIYQVIQAVLIIFLGNYIGINGLALAVVLALSFQASYLCVSSKYFEKKN
jgi:O-antigen/teichoic acid export membrane protein